MQFDFDAGKYAFFVWTAFAATGLVLGALVVDTLVRSARWRRKAEAAQARKDAGK